MVWVGKYAEREKKMEQNSYLWQINGSYVLILKY